MEPNRTEWQKRCTFNGFCKKVLKNEAIDVIRENRTRRKHEVVFSELTPQEKSQLYTYDHGLRTRRAEWRKMDNKTAAAACVPAGGKTPPFCCTAFRHEHVEVRSENTCSQYSTAGCSFELLNANWRNGLMNGTNGAESRRRGLHPPSRRPR
ncbi:MAG: hypothetical protein ACLUIO_23525 [Neglectibacter timonensis]